MNGDRCEVVRTTVVHLDHAGPRTVSPEPQCEAHLQRANSHVDGATGSGPPDGRGPTSADAGTDAKHALEPARQGDRRVARIEPDQEGP